MLAWHSGSWRCSHVWATQSSLIQMRDRPYKTWTTLGQMANAHRDRQTDTQGDSFFTEWGTGGRDTKWQQKRGPQAVFLHTCAALSSEAMDLSYSPVLWEHSCGRTPCRTRRRWRQSCSLGLGPRTPRNICLLCSSSLCRTRTRPLESAPLDGSGATP